MQPCRMIARQPMSRQNCALEVDAVYRCVCLITVGIEARRRTSRCESLARTGSGDA